MRKPWVVLVACTLLAGGLASASPPTIAARSAPAPAPAAELPPAPRTAEGEPAPAQAACNAAGTFGLEAALAQSQKIGYIDGANGFRYQATLAVNNPSGTPAGQLLPFNGQNTADGRTQVLNPRVAAADLNGSGYKQLVTAFTDGGFNYTKPGEPDPLFEPPALQIVTLDYTTSVTGTPTLNRWRGNPPGNARFNVSGLAAGNLGFSTNGSEQVAMTTLEGTEQVGGDNKGLLYLFGGTDKSGAGAIAQADDAFLSRTSLPGKNPQEALAAVGPLTISTTNSVVTAVIGGDDGTGVNGIGVQVWTKQGDQLAQVATTRLITEATDISLALGDIDGSFSKSIVLAATTTQGSRKQVSVWTWKLVPGAGLPATQVLSATGFWANAADGLGPAEVTTADLNADGRQEIILADKLALPISGNAGNISTRVTTVRLPANGALTATNVFSRPLSINDGTPPVLAAGTIETSGYEAVMLGTNESDGVTAQQPFALLALADPGDKGLGVVAGPLRNTLANRGPLVVADIDGLRGLYAQYANQCRSVTEAHLNGVVFVPPAWANFNAAGTSGRYGIGTTNTSDSGTTATTSKGAGVNASVGVGFKAGAEFIATGAEVKVIASATFAKDWFATATRNTSQVTTTATSIAQSNTKDFVIFDQTDYLCYNYQVKQDGAPLDDGNVLACLPTSPQLPSGRDVGTWTAQAGTTISKYQWIPAVREWTNLAIGGTASQSSSDGAAAASRAIDGRLDGLAAKNSVAQTTVEQQPWWQLDLGSVQLIDIVSIWNRTDPCCYSNTQNFNLFVSATPFTSNDPAVLATQTGVWSYTFNGQPGPVSHIATKQNGGSVRGRYLRVQLNGSTSLGLAEVQVFSLARLDPDQFPTAVSDGTAADGQFEVTLRNGQKRVVHGELIWPSANSSYANTDAIPQQIVAPGNNNLSWSMRRDNTDRRLTANETGENTAIGLQVESEFAVKNGPVVKATIGGRYTWGYKSGSSTGTGFGQNFEISGNVAAMPATAPQACGYRFQPYFYEATGQSNYGFVKKYRVVDYLVTQVQGLLTGEDLAVCRQKPTQASLLASATIGKPGSSFSFTASGLPGNTPISVAVKGPGESTYREALRLTTNADGQLVFVLLTTPESKAGVYSIRITAQPAGVTAQQGTVAETSITLDAGGALLVNPLPGDTPNATVGGLRPLFLALVRR